MHGYFQVHKSSIARFAHEADMIDILDAMKSINNAQVCIFRFIAGNCDRGPVELNIVSLAEHTGAVERELLCLKDIKDSVK